jgi:hypothetical protein
LGKGVDEIKAVERAKSKMVEDEDRKARTGKLFQGSPTFRGSRLYTRNLGSDIWVEKEISKPKF